MRRVFGLAVVTAALAGVATPPVSAQDRAALEKRLVANERSINRAVAEGDLDTFKSLVAADGVSIDMSGRMPTGETIRTFDNFRRLLRLKTWDLSEFQVTWLSGDAALVTYKWEGTGTYRGEPVPSPVWCSSVWAQRDGQWMAVFHQETAAVEAPQ